MCIFTVSLFASQANAAKNNPQDIQPQGFVPTGVFNSVEMLAEGAAPILNWQNAQMRLRNERKLVERCEYNNTDCPKILLDWQAKIASWQGLSVSAKIARVNRFANRAIRYTDDRKQFRKSDYWATPLQSLKGRGDCEDYVLLKYESLRALGIPKKNMRIVVVMDQRKNIAHAVLSVKTAEGTFILDNQDQRILRHDSITYYAPLYSLNEQGRWLNIATRQVKRKLAPVLMAVKGKTVVEPAAELPPAKLRTASLDQPSTAETSRAIWKPRFAYSGAPLQLATVQVEAVSISEREPVDALPPAQLRLESTAWLKSDFSSAL